VQPLQLLHLAQGFAATERVTPIITPGAQHLGRMLLDVPVHVTLPQRLQAWHPVAGDGRLLATSHAPQGRDQLLPRRLQVLHQGL